MIQLDRGFSHSGIDGTHLHLAVALRRLLILEFLIALQAPLLLGCARFCPPSDPFQFLPQYRLTLALTRLGALLPLRLPLQIAGIIRLIAVDCPLVHLDNTVADAVKKIAVMRDHHQRTAPFFQIIFQPVRHCRIQMVRRLVQNQHITRH